jgi:hypothetical protein
MDRSKLFQKFLAVQKELKALPKSGRNDFHHYNYTTAVDALETIREACNHQDLIVFASVVDSKVEPGKAWVNVCLTIANTESSETISVNAPGYAEDWSYKENRPTGDKAIYKAITGATKYAVRELFCLPSEEDPERPAQKSYNSGNSTGRGMVQLTREEWLARVNKSPATGKPS